MAKAAKRNEEAEQKRLAAEQHRKEWEEKTVNLLAVLDGILSFGKLALSAATWVGQIGFFVDRPP